MNIQIEPHTLERANERGTDESEILEAINTGTEIPAKHGRLGRAKVYPYNRKRHGRHYPQKRVEVF